MLEIIRHRGPNDWGRYDDRHISMGMRRLSVIDLSSGHQPLSNEDHSVWIVFNGEIYNYLELRNELESSGHVFRTTSDTEVIVHLYEEYGSDCWKRLNGMFAVAIWDTRSQCLHLARDPVGIKPLYWMRCGQTLVFSSELKSLARYGPLGDIDPDSMAAYFHLGYVPRDRTIYSSVNRLLPGHRLVASVDHPSPRITRFWSLSQCFSSGNQCDTNPEELTQLLDQAVRIQLRSDVPIGCFLSGGLDSSVISALAVRHLPNLDTFGVRFEDHHFDESPFAREVARHIGSRHHELVVTSHEVPDLLADLAWYMDEPNWDPAIIPSYLISKYAKSRVTVALSGTGGDEIFGGYRRHWELRPDASMADRLRQWVPRRCRESGIHLLQRFRVLRQSSKLARLAASNQEVYFGYGISLDQGNMMDRLFPFANGRFNLLQWVRTVFEEVETDPVNSMLYYDSSCYLPDQLLPVLDRTSMAVSLESRVPLLDLRLIEAMARVSGDRKIRPGEGKRLLKESARHLLPPSIINRPKLGFGAPVRRWIQHPTVRALMSDASQGPLAKDGWMDQTVFMSLLNQADRRDQNAALLWSVMMLHLWMVRQNSAQP